MSDKRDIVDILIELAHRGNSTDAMWRAAFEIVKLRLKLASRDAEMAEHNG